MKRTVLILGVFCALWLAVLTAAVVARSVEQNPPAGQTAPRTSWLIPAAAADEKSPLTINPAVLANGKKLFGEKCQRCHGAEGKGDGPEGEPEHVQDMNLTVGSRAARNPDGVVFYKVWNGRPSPKMPEFSKELSKEQVWAIVAYVQTLRAKTAGQQ